ncbi:MAG: CBS domain-containing protein [Parvibaculaceae bacterium]
MSKEVVSIRPDAGVLEATELMIARRLSGLPVVDATGALMGIITEGDLLRRWEMGTQRRHTGFAAFKAGLERVAADYVQSHGRHVRDLMTAKVITVDEITPVETVVHLLEQHGFRRLPVVREGRVVGIVSRADILRAFVAAAHRMGRDGQSDEEIRRGVFAIYTRESWAPLDRVDVSIKDGIVELYGTIDNEGQRRALIVAAESVIGVKGVRDHMKCQPAH